MAEPIIRPASSDDLERFYQKSPPVSVRAWVADLGGEILAVAGVTMAGIYFSDMRPEMHRYRKAIVRGAATMLREAGVHRGIALADEDLPSAPRTLAHFGFVAGEDGRWKRDVRA